MAQFIAVANFKCGKDEKGAPKFYKAGDVFKGSPEQVKAFKEAGLIQEKELLEKAEGEALLAQLIAKEDEIKNLREKLAVLQGKGEKGEKKAK